MAGELRGRALSDFFEDLAERFKPRARERAAELRRLLVDACDAPTLEAARREAHNLAGTAGSYGLGAFGAAVKELEAPLREAEGKACIAEDLRARLLAELDAALGLLDA